MAFAVNRRALWVFMAVLMLVTIATGQGELGLAAMIAATTIIELLTWIGPLLAAGGDARPKRRAPR
jgi:hypothetical protein